MSILQKSNKQTSFFLLGFSIFCALFQLILILTINTYSLYLIGFFLLIFPIGLAGSLSNRISKIINDLSSNNSPKHEYKMIMYIALYYFLLGLIYFAFSSLVFNINMGTGANGKITGTTLSIIIIITSFLCFIYYGIRFLLSKK